MRLNIEQHFHLLEKKHHKQSNSDLILKKWNSGAQKIGEGTALKVHELKDKSILAVWEKDDQVVFKKI